MRSRNRPAQVAAIFNEKWAGPNLELGTSITFEREILHYVSLFRGCGTFFGFVLRMKLLILSPRPTE